MTDDASKPGGGIVGETKTLRWQDYPEWCGYSEIREMPNGRYACLAPYAFTTAILVGRQGDVHTFEDRWCYHGRAVALAALDAWHAAGFAGEPLGWHRQPATGRRRPGGDPLLEFVEP
jgi:hypothetical protein